MVGKIQWKENVTITKKRRHKTRPKIEYYGDEANRNQLKKQKKLEMSADMPRKFPYRHWTRSGKVVPTTGKYSVGDLIQFTEDMFIALTPSEHKYELKFPVMVNYVWSANAAANSEKIPKGAIITYMGVYEKVAKSYPNTSINLKKYEWDTVMYKNAIYCVGPNLDSITEFLA